MAAKVKRPKYSDEKAQNPWQLVRFIGGPMDRTVERYGIDAPHRLLLDLGRATYVKTRPVSKHSMAEYTHEEA